MWLWAMVQMLGCSEVKPKGLPEASWSIVGSETAMDRLVPQLLVQWAREHQGGRVPRRAISTDTEAFRSLISGSAEVIVVGRSHTANEALLAKGVGLDLDVARNLLAVDVVTIASARRSSGVTYDQVVGIFCEGSIDSWDFLVDGGTGPIIAVVPQALSARRALFEDFFCGPRGFSKGVVVAGQEAINTMLETREDVITISSLSADAGEAWPLKVNASAPAVPAKASNIITGKYPLYQDIYVYHRANPPEEVTSIIKWVASPAGQHSVDEVGFVPIHLRPQTADNARPLRETVHFDPGAQQPNIRSQVRLELLIEELKTRIQSDPSYRHVILEGFTDDREFNSLDLSNERALSVQKILQKELSGYTLLFEVIPRGAERPLAPNETPFGRLRNRRVEVYLATEEREVSP